MNQLTIEALAKQVGIATRTLHGWIARGCPRDSADAVRAWRAENMQPRRIAGIASPLWEEERQSRIRKLTADAEAIEMRTAAKRRELYRADEVKANLEILLGMIRERLATIPCELAEEFPPECRDFGRQRVGDRIALLGREIDGWRFDYEPEAMDIGLGEDFAIGAVASA